MVLDAASRVLVGRSCTLCWFVTTVLVLIGVDVRVGAFSISFSVASTLADWSEASGLTWFLRPIKFRSLSVQIRVCLSILLANLCKYCQVVAAVLYAAVVESRTIFSIFVHTISYSFA